MSKSMPWGKGDYRRVLQLAVAIEEAEVATLSTMSQATGLHKQTVVDDIIRMAQLGIHVEKVGAAYHIVSWGPALKKSGVKKLLQGQLN